MKNFEFEHDGKKYWYSRSICTVALLFATDDTGKWYVLANKRGLDEKHKWNCPAGYLDFEETIAECAAREVYEETGLNISPDVLHLVFINDNPKETRQNVTFRYVGLLNEKVEDLSKQLNSSHSEKNEVEEIKFIPVEDIDNYEWAFNHDNLIKSYSPKIIYNDN